MKQIAFLLKRGQSQVLSICQDLIDAVTNRKKNEIPLVISDSLHLPSHWNVSSEANLPKDLQMLVVLGGDGTLLHGASLLPDGITPILGVNLGHLGFLSTCSKEQAVSMLHSALDGKLPIEERARLHCQIYQELPQTSQQQKNVLLAEKFALNEVVLSQPAQARLFELEAYLDKSWIITYKADGLIVSTPTGSTAYNLAAGGPILPPQMNGVVMTPICPHTLTARPLVVPMSSTISIRPGNHVSKVLVTVDGGWNIEIEPHQFVQITQAAHPIRIFRTDDYSFFDVLRTKLQWGSRGDGG